MVQYYFARSQAGYYTSTTQNTVAQRVRYKAQLKRSLVSRVWTKEKSTTKTTKNNNTYKGKIMIEVLIKDGNTIYGWSELSYDVARGMHNKGVLNGDLVTLDSWRDVMKHCVIDDTHYDDFLGYLYDARLTLDDVSDLLQLSHDDMNIVKMLRASDENNMKLVELDCCTIAVLDKENLVAYVTDYPDAREAIKKLWGGANQIDDPQILEDYYIVDVLLSGEGKHDIDVLMGKRTLADYKKEHPTEDIWVADNEDNISPYPNNPEDYKESPYGDFRYKGARYRIAIIKSAKEL